MQPIKALQTFIYIVTRDVTNNTYFKDNLRLYNMDNIYISDKLKLDEIFYRCEYRVNNNGIKTVFFDDVKPEDIEFRIVHKIIKCLKNDAVYKKNVGDKDFDIYHYYIGYTYDLRERSTIYGADPDRNCTLYNQICVKTMLNDTRTNETILNILALNDSRIELGTRYAKQ